MIDIKQIILHGKKLCRQLPRAMRFYASLIQEAHSYSNDPINRFMRSVGIRLERLSNRLEYRQLSEEERLNIQRSIEFFLRDLDILISTSVKDLGIQQANTEILTESVKLIPNTLLEGLERGFIRPSDAGKFLYRVNLANQVKIYVQEFKYLRDLDPDLTFYGTEKFPKFEDFVDQMLIRSNSKLCTYLGMPTRRV